MSSYLCQNINHEVYSDTIISFSEINFDSLLYSVVHANIRGWGGGVIKLIKIIIKKLSSVVHIVKTAKEINQVYNKQTNVACVYTHFKLISTHCMH